MEQLRHRLINVSPKGKRRSVDQNTLKRSDLDDFVSCYFGKPGAIASAVSAEKAGKRSAGDSVRYNQSAEDSRRYNRHERKDSEQSGDSRRQSERVKTFTYEELTKRDKVSLDILMTSLPSLSQPLGLPA